MAQLSESERKILENNPNVLKVTKANVTYTPAFKEKAIKLHNQGVPPSRIFSNAGINVEIFGEGYAKKCIRRWKKVSSSIDSDCFKKERRGSKSTGRPKGRKFKSLEEENAYLRAELDFLKKLRALEAKYEKKKNSR